MLFKKWRWSEAVHNGSGEWESRSILKSQAREFAQAQYILMKRSGIIETAVLGRFLWGHPWVCCKWRHYSLRHPLLILRPIYKVTAKTQAEFRGKHPKVKRGGRKRIIISVSWQNLPPYSSSPIHAKWIPPKEDILACL